jgi:alpha-galactosidase
MLPQPWHENMGNWFPRPHDFPRGLRPLGDAAHGRGMKFVVWFAPLWVCPRTAFAKEHPQFIHGGEDGGIWRVGEDRARAWITDWVAQRIDDWGIDIYRQDIDNALPPDEGPDRVGIAEMRHIEGFYQFWSDLLTRHPRLLIDNCCGGGRRIDLETSSRAFTLWRSDFNDIGEGLQGKSHWPLMGRADQVMVSGLSLYLPFHTGPVWDMRPYCLRSAMSSGIVLYNDLESRDFSSDLTRQGIAELKRLRPYFQGDIYPLLDLTTSQADWYAYQLDRPDLAAGCVLAFRRPESPDESRELCLQAIDPAAQYDVRVTGETYAPAATQTLRGRDLGRLTIRIATQPGSALVEYTRR